MSAVPQGPSSAGGTPPAPSSVQKVECVTDLAVADSVAEAFAQALSGRAVFRVALSGGRIAAGLFEALVRRIRREGLSCEGLQFFWADERCVPAADQESNYRLALGRLLDPLGINPGRVHRIRGEADPALAAEEAGKALVAAGGRLDLVLLGMGEDGHVASLFPGLPPALVECREAYFPVVGPKPPPRRVTLSYRTLAEAEAVWVLVAGAGKQGVLRRALAGDTSLPIGRVLNSRALTRLWVSGSASD